MIAHARVDDAKVVQGLDVVGVRGYGLLEPVTGLYELLATKVDRAKQQERLGILLQLDCAIQNGLSRRVIVLTAIGSGQELHGRRRGLCALQDPPGSLHGLREQTIGQLRLREGDEQRQVIRIVDSQLLQGLDELAGPLHLGLQPNKEELSWSKLGIRVDGAARLDGRVLILSLPETNSSHRVVTARATIFGGLRQGCLRLGAGQFSAIHELIRLPGVDLARGEVRGRPLKRLRCLDGGTGLGPAVVVGDFVGVGTFSGRGPSTGSGVRRGFRHLGGAVCGLFLFLFLVGLVGLIVLVGLVVFPLLLVVCLGLLRLVRSGLRPRERDRGDDQAQGQAQGQEPGRDHAHQRPSGVRVSMV